MVVVSKRLPNLRPFAIPSPIIGVDEALDTRRQQYHSTRLIAILESQTKFHNYDKILGVTSLDLYNPAMDGHGFVFGEARCPGISGIVSTARLQATGSNQDSFESRVRKEAVHEIGHMEGLKHCPNACCVMHQSLSVAHTDFKTGEYCDECQRRLEEA